MKWKSNAKFGQQPEAGTIFWLKDFGPSLCIHNIIGLGNQWFLSCRDLYIDDQPLETEDFNEAVSHAKEFVRNRLALLQEAFGAFAADTSENEFSRH